MTVRRHIPIVARLMLLWFALTQLAAVAAPLLAPAPQGQQICSAHGDVRWVADPGVHDDAAPGVSAHGIHCPLCVPMGGPPSGDFLLTLLLPAPASRQGYECISASVVSRARAPIPPRGPPALS